MYAIIETGGKQYKVSPGDNILVEKLEGKEGENINFNKVLLLVDNSVVNIGTPYVENASVGGKILSQEKGEKIRVSKFKAKVRYRKTTGHRQLLTKIAINDIKTGKTAKKPTPKKKNV